MTDFASPATASGMDMKALNGSLLLITPKAYEEDINTSFGMASAIRADVIVLDGSSKGESYLDALIFQRVLQSQLRPNIGKKVLGRLTQGVAKSNQSPPWTLSEATDADKEVATRYLAYVNSQSVATPAAAAPAGSEYGDVTPAAAQAAPADPW